MADKTGEGLEAPLSVSGSENKAQETETEAVNKDAKETGDKIEAIVSDAVEDVAEEAAQCQTEAAADAAAFLETLQRIQQTHMGMMGDMLDKMRMILNRMEELTQSRAPLTQEPLSQPQTEAPAETVEAPAETVETVEVAPEESAAESPVVKKRIRRVI